MTTDLRDLTALLPTDEDVAAYARDGFWVCPPVLPDDVLDSAERGMTRFYAGDVDAPFPGTTPYDRYDWTPADGDVLRKNDYTSLQVRDIAALVQHPLLGAISARLSGAQEIRLWHDQLLYKPPGAGDASGNVGWHTDRQYWQGCSSEQMLTAWVPFHDCDERTGGVTFVRGSHRWDQGRLDFWETDLAAGERAFAAGDAPVEKVTPVLPRGSLTFHHCRTVHGSGPNLSDRPRRSVAVHLQPGDNTWTAPPPRPDGGPTDHRNDALVRRLDGRPDYADPRICPRIWPA